MANDFNRQQLEQAYDLIEEDRHEDAVRFIRRVLENEATNPPQDNANAYWLLANTTEEPSDARRYLISVLKYNPAHSMASQTLEELNTEYPPNDNELIQLMELERTSDFDLADLSAPLSDDELANLFDEDREIDTSDFDDDEDPFAELEALGRTDKKSDKKSKKGREKRSEKKRRSILAPVVLLLALILFGAVLFALVNNSGETITDDGQPDLTQLVGLSLDSESETLAFVNDVQADAQQTVGDAAVFIVDNGDTQTIFVQTCICIRRDCQGKSSSELFSTIEESFLTIAERAEAQSIESIAQAGVNVTVCQTNDNVYRATTAIENVIAYLNNQDLSTFQATWAVAEG